MRKNLIYRCKLSVLKQRDLIRLFVCGVTARQAARVVGVNRNTAIRIFRLFRMKIALNRAALSVFRDRAEIDECYLSGGKGGRKAAKRGRSLDGKFAIVGVTQFERNSGLRRVRFECVERVDSQTLTAFARAHVEPGAEIHTDQLASYKLRAAGFVHRTVNHHKNFKDPKTGACTNLIENAWSLMRRHFDRFCGGWRHNLTLWLREMEMRIECGMVSFFGAFQELMREQN